jgi:hypothetical protein
VAPFTPSWQGQGWRTLNSIAEHNFREELCAPAAFPTFHVEVRFPVGMLFESPRIDPPAHGKVLSRRAITDPVAIFAGGDIQTPLISVLHSQMTKRDFRRPFGIASDPLF